jgi:glycerol-3-phosphate dehydrogenase
MKRDEMLRQLKNQNKAYDVLIIGGGATGIGVALEAASKGYSTLLVEQADFTKSTSSKSTKLVHGGVRYMAQGDLGLVREACTERGRLLHNAPHLVKNQSFIIPAFGLYDEVLYTAGLTFYDLLAGKYSLGRSLHISKKNTLKRISTLKGRKISAGILYHDGQFDDSRLAINVLQTAAEQGAHLLNYAKVTQLTKDQNGFVDGADILDLENNINYHIKAKAIVNATGVFADKIMQMDRPEMPGMIKPSQGVHIVLDKSFLPGDDALMIPKTDDGRVLFAVPWHNKVVVGTTDTPIESASLEPVALDDEISFILNTMAKYMEKAPKRSDVRSIFAGLRPLAAPKGEGKKTREISRSHKIFVSPSHLFTMVGGKWTTFRRMAEDMMEKIEQTKSWPKKASSTKKLKLHGYQKDVDRSDPLYVYGSDRAPMLALAKENKAFEGLISDSFPLYKAQVVWAARYEMARTVEDVLSRRTRCLLLDARESIRIAPQVAHILAMELDKDEQWEKQQVNEYEAVAQQYFLN